MDTANLQTVQANEATGIYAMKKATDVQEQQMTAILEGTVGADSTQSRSRNIIDPINRRIDVTA